MTDRFMTVDNTRYVFQVETGRVMGSSKYAETHVTSSGGSTYVGPGGGNVATPRISSYSTVNQEFWLATSDGREVDFKLTRNDVPMLPDQQISVVTCRPIHPRKKYMDTPVFLKNHNSGKDYWLAGSRSFTPRRLPGLLHFFMAIGMAIAFVVLFAGENVGLGVSGFLATPFVYLAIYLISSSRKNKRFHQLFVEKVSMLSSQSPVKMTGT